MDDVFNETPAAPEPEPEPIITPDPAPEVASAPKDEPQSAPAPEPPSEPEEIGTTDKERAFLSKANDEKRKRQAIERERDDLRSQIVENNRQRDIEQKQWKQHQAQQVAQPETPKEFWEDPEGALKNFEEKMEAREITATLNIVERIARAKYPDFDEKLEAFAEVMQTTPGVHKEWITSNDPAEYAYKLGTSTLLFRRAKDMPTLIEQARAEGRMEAEASFKTKEDDRQRKMDNIPNSLTDLRSVGGNSRAVWNGPPSLASILE